MSEELKNTAKEYIDFMNKNINAFVDDKINIEIELAKSTEYKEKYDALIAAGKDNPDVIELDKFVQEHCQGPFQTENKMVMLYDLEVSDQLDALNTKIAQLT